MPPELSVPRVVDAGFGIGLGSYEPVVLVLGSRVLFAFGGRNRTTGTLQNFILEARGVQALQYGLPNDEALEGHPLAAHGLESYGVYEVLGPPWLREVEARHQVVFPKSNLDGMRHFVPTFHEKELVLTPVQPIASATSGRASSR